MNIVIILIILAFLLYGLYIGKNIKLKEYTSYNKRANQYDILLSLLSSLVGGWMFFGLIAIGYEAGILGYILGVGYAIGLLILSKLVPKIKKEMNRLNSDTLDDVIRAKFGLMPHIAIVSLNFIFFLSVLAAQFIAISSLVSIFNEDLNYTLILIFTAITTIIYTAGAGHKGVIFTDKLQILFISFASLILFVFLSLNTSMSEVMHINTPGFFRGTSYGIGFLVGVIIFFPFTLISRTDLWQRIASSKTEKEVQKGFILIIPVLLIFYFLFTSIGIIAQTIIHNPITTEGSGLEAFLQISDNIFVPEFILFILSTIVILGILSALFSTIDTNLNVVAVITSKLVSSKLRYFDFKQNINLNENFAIWYVRLMTVVIGLFGLVFSLLFPDIVNLIVGAGTILLILLPSVLSAIFENIDPDSNPEKKLASTISMYSGLFIFIIFFIFINPKIAFIPSFVVSLLFFYVFSKIKIRR